MTELSTAGTGVSSPFVIRGVIEGFYGTYYTFPERNDLIRFLARHDFNFYLYGPKNDRQHRMRWWDPYPPAILDEFACTIELAEQSGIDFCYAISFGVPLNYASKEDFTTVTNKLRAFYDRGCRAFGVLLDDLTDGLVHEVNRRAYPSVAQAHADYCNRIEEWARSLDPGCRIYLCPSEYCGRAPFTEYLHDLGAHLSSGVEVFYSGPEICSPEIRLNDVEAFGAAARRLPVIWDNYPANDLAMRAELHIGALRGRDSLLPLGCRGFVSNLMNQAEASKIALITIAEYLASPVSYDADAAWARALREVGGDDIYDALVSFAENTLASCLSDQEAPRLSLLAFAALASLQAGETISDSEAVAELAGYINTLDESTYRLKNRMRNLHLRRDLLPWIEALDDKFWLGRGALMLLVALEEGKDPAPSLRFLDGLLSETQKSPKRIAGNALLQLAEYARRRAGAEEVETSKPNQSAQSAAEFEATAGAGADGLPPSHLVRREEGALTHDACG